MELLDWKAIPGGVQWMGLAETLRYRAEQIAAGQCFCGPSLVMLLREAADTLEPK